MTTIGIITAGTCREDDGIDEVEMPIIIYKDIIGHSIKDVMNTIRVIIAVVLGMETQTYELIMDFVLGGQTSFNYEWLN